MAFPPKSKNSGGKPPHSALPSNAETALRCGAGRLKQGSAFSEGLSVKDGAGRIVAVPVRLLAQQGAEEQLQRLIGLIGQILTDGEVHLTIPQQRLDLRAAVMGQDVDAARQPRSRITSAQAGTLGFAIYTSFRSGWASSAFRTASAVFRSSRWVALPCRFRQDPRSSSRSRKTVHTGLMGAVHRVGVDHQKRIPSPEEPGRNLPATRPAWRPSSPT